MAGLAISLNLNAQLSEEKSRQIDSIFLSWNQPNHPGGTVGIMKEGKVVYSKAFGLASLEYLVPNTPGTRFNIASVSKQFTSMGIVLLDLQGKLSMDDDIRIHLPELPDFGDTITIRHLMHHTSGLRSLHALLGLAGWRGDDSRTNEDLLRLMKNQKDLNFPPGNEYLYCNTGYMFMADIIERVSGETFADWMLENVLLALGMIHTYVEDDYSRVVPSNATSYYDSNDSDFSRAVEFWGYVGSGNIHSTTGDLLNWLSCYYHPPTGWEDAFELMQTRGILNKGDTLSYAFGVMVDEYKTHRRLQHGGAIGGYRSMAQAFPDEELNLVLLTNFSSSDVGSKIGRMADLMLGIESEAEEGGLIMEASIRTIPLPAGELEKYSAYFWSHEANHSRKIYLKEDTLRYFRSESSESKLLPVGKDTFQMIDVPSRVMVSFELIGNQPIAMIVQVEDFETDLLEAYLPPEIQGDMLQYYTGKYFSSELDTYYSISVQGDTLLMANHVRHGDFEIKVLREDILEADYPLRSIRVERDKRGRISGFYVSNGRVRNLWFEKQ
jgi:CubicO group peptidase (beta-lactamase class C family)